MSSNTQPLVEGGHLRYPDRYPSTFITTTPPIIHENTRILAVTHPNIAKADPIHQDGWFLSDFYAFNYMLKGLGSSQKWLTAADPVKLLEKYGPFLHGNPYQDRKVVLSQEMLDQDQLSPVTLVKTTDMIRRFLEEARIESEKAKYNNSPLLLLVFCHGLESFEMLLDNGNRSKGLRLQQLKGVLEPGVQVCLMTNACFSGGWAITPDLNRTALTAASELSTSNAWPPSHSVGRACGSIFASTVFETLCGVSSPLLSTEGSQDMTQSMQDLEISTDDHLQPDEPTDIQVETYNAFCNTILDVCGSRVTRLWKQQEFTFSAQDDQWEYSWTNRTGVPLIAFEKRWSQLQVIPYVGPADTKALKDPHPGNPFFSGETHSSKTGGVAHEQETLEDMTACIYRGRVKEMARIFLNTCPGDWTQAQNVPLASLLRHWVGDQEKCAEETCAERGFEVINTIQFRWEFALLADHIIATYNLPTPSNEICITWDEEKWNDTMSSKVPKHKEKFREIWFALVAGGFLLIPSESQGPRFYRPMRYVTAALAELGGDWGHTKTKVDQILNFMEKTKQFNRDRICQDHRVRERGRDWFKSIGRRIRRSLSPTKKDRRSSISALSRSGSQRSSR
ncbi:uncharacterized protein JN550_008719 [Neoarthrinium moseri]|uniref:uncharacterized protein n=1 Tax=Neoarthrinium moseri TaxID=1658444 RepID=UPI001FDBD2E6|nr:uncharacterized protein JN550_008719 [Neoarthrinium moseri]KAI1864899.1 hypothetical protein JN550_008719 [Neoarthrinium moseri]